MDMPIQKSDFREVYRNFAGDPLPVFVSHRTLEDADSETMFAAGAEIRQAGNFALTAVARIATPVVCAYGAAIVAKEHSGKWAPLAIPASAALACVTGTIRGVLGMVCDAARMVGYVLMAAGTVVYVAGDVALSGIHSLLLGNTQTISR